MRKSVLIAIILFCLQAFMTPASAWPILVTDTNNIPFYEEIIEIHYADANSTKIKYSSTNSSGYVNFEIPNGYEKVDFILRAGGSIYFGSTNPGAERIKLHPIAKITAFVIDDKENYLKGVTLKIGCAQPISPMPSKTNEIGYFEISEVGLGECTITMIKGERLKTYQLNLNQSKEYALKILFPDEKLDYASPSILIFLSFVVLLAILIIILLTRKIILAKRKLAKYSTITHHPHQSQSPSVSSMDLKSSRSPSDNSIIGTEFVVDRTAQIFNDRQKDLMKTLSETENKIIIFLRNHDGHATQSQIRYDTGLPKATLHRHISKLQGKGIASVHEYGKLKKVLLTDFFLKE